MEIASIKGDTVLLLYHPAEAAADVGQQFTVLELLAKTEGLVVEIVSNDSLEYAGLQQEMIQRILEQRIAEVMPVLDLETGMGEIKSLKLAAAKVRKRIEGGEWKVWDGWIPTRNVEIDRIEADELIKHVLPDPKTPLRSFARFDSTPIQFNGPQLNMVNVIAGVKGSGKSHLAKHVVLALAEKGVPCITFDINGEYVNLPDVQVLRWGDNFLPDLAKTGQQMLEMVLRSVYPLGQGTAGEAVFESQLPDFFSARRRECESAGKRFTIDLEYLHSQPWRGGNYVVDAIQHRLAVLDGINLF